MQHQRAAAHVTPPDKVRRKYQLLTKDLEQYLSIFTGGDAAQKHGLAVGSDLSFQRFGAASQRPDITRFSRVDAYPGKGPQIRNLNDPIGIEQSSVGRDHPNHIKLTGELARVGNLTPEIEPAREAEDLAQRSAFGSQTHRQIEAGSRFEQHLCAKAVGPGRGEQKRRWHGQTMAGTAGSTTHPARTSSVSAFSPKPLNLSKH